MRLPILLVLLLLAANALFMIYDSGDLARWLGMRPVHEPERVNAQLNADRLKLLPPEQPAAEKIASAPAAKACRAVVGLAADESGAARQLLASADLVVRTYDVSEPVAWVAHIPPQADRKAQLERVAELKKLNIKDYFVIQNPPRLRNGIALGTFKSEGAAAEQVQRLQKRGVKLARVGVMEDASLPVVEAMGEKGDLDAGMEALKRRYPAVRTVDCRR